MDCGLDKNIISTLNFLISKIIVDENVLILKKQILYSLDVNTWLQPTLKLFRKKKLYTGRIRPTLTTGEHTQRTLFCTVLPTFLYIFISKLKKEEEEKNCKEHMDNSWRVSYKIEQRNQVEVRGYWLRMGTGCPKETNHIIRGLRLCATRLSISLIFTKVS